MEAIKHKDNDHVSSEGREKSKPHSSIMPVLAASGEGVQHEYEINDGVIAVQSGSRSAEETECNSQPQDKFLKSATSTTCLNSSPIHHDKLEIENKLILEPFEPDLQSSTMDVSCNINEVNTVAIDGVETCIHSLESMHGVESKAEEDSHVMADAITHSEESNFYTSGGEVILDDISGVKNEAVAAQTEINFQVNSEANEFCNSAMPHDLPDFTSGVPQADLPQESISLLTSVEQDLQASSCKCTQEIPVVKEEITAFEI